MKTYKILITLLLIFGAINAKAQELKNSAWGYQEIITTGSPTEEQRQKIMALDLALRGCTWRFEPNFQAVLEFGDEAGKLSIIKCLYQIKSKNGLQILQFSSTTDLPAVLMQGKIWVSYDVLSFEVFSEKGNEGSYQIRFRKK